MSGEEKILLSPGSTIGIIGGGQLGRMLSTAASRLGFHSHIYDPHISGPAAEVSKFETNGEYDDLKRIKAFVEACDVITYEFENVPASTAAFVEKIKPLYPGSFPLKIAQDRYIEKNFIRDDANVPVTEFEKVSSLDDLKKAIRKIGLPAVLKTRRFGYDGKGQFIIKSHNEISLAWESMKNSPQYWNSS
jgi:5-(carboxyamino)imidazole ribonucleotide synthase